METLIDLRNVSKTYRTGSFNVEALKGVSLRIKAGELVSLTGPSGSGKSTLMHILGFLDRLDSGEYYFAGNPTTDLDEGRLAAIRSRMVGFIFQSFHLLKRTTAKDNVMLPMVYSGLGTEPRKALECLRLVGLSDRVNHKSNELSGGQCQRVAVARALVNDPFILLADEPTGNLDAKSRQEVMQVIKDLNARGLTVIIVTHDEEVSAQTRRVIRMKDGAIISDETRPDPAVPGRPDRSGETGTARLPQARLGFTPSEIGEQLRVAFKAIWSHKTRSALTVLGIFIGVGSIISLMTISEGFMKSLLSGSSEDDAKKVYVMPRQERLKASRRLTYSDVEAIRSGAPLAEKITPIVQGNVQASAGNKHVDADLQSREGFTPEAQKANKKIFENRALEGRFFTPAENLGRARVAVINRTLAKKLFGSEPAVNSELRLKGITFTVIGVAEDQKSEQIFGGRPTAYVPLNTASKRVFGSARLDYIVVSAPTPADSSQTRKQVILALRKAHALREDKDDDFEVKTFEAQIQMFKEGMGKVSLVVYAIAGISLLVGGIGIMNIMLVSVTERTREIGLRKALGAKNSDILGQFLIEAVTLCLIGGALGVALGLGLGWAAYFFIKVPPTLGLGTICFAFGFSTVIGVSFGFWPALRAAMLDPIEALRYE
ncbi:MAG: ABC transporter permease [Elusimicrobiales bacterium]|jgi:macrolide transport system ATP-binding/permease protein